MAHTAKVAFLNTSCQLSNSVKINLTEKVMYKLSRKYQWFGCIGFAIGLTGALSLSGCVTVPDETQTETSASALNNFGFPLGFSVEKMDANADPRQDFRRYAAGRWLDAAKIPSDSVRISNIDVLVKVVEAQQLALLEEAARDSINAPKGTPLQQVGDFFAAGMDESRLIELGVKPLQPELDRIAKIQDKKSLAEEVARLNLLTDDILLLGLVVGTDPSDRTRSKIYIGDAELYMGLDNYLKPEAQPIRAAYVKLITDSLVIVGNAPEVAAAVAAKVLAMDTRIAAKKLTPVELQDPAKRFVGMSYANFKAQLSNFDVDTLFRSQGMPTSGELIVVQANALRERNAMLAELSLDDTKAYLSWELLRRSTAYLTPAFLGPQQAFSQAMYGKIDMPPLNQRMAAVVPNKLGHPLGQVYVNKHFSTDTKREVEDLIQRVRAEFRERVAKNSWLEPSTRAEALKKLDAARIDVGYPATWIDYSDVDIRRDDYLGNVQRINEFVGRRNLAKYGKPVVEDGFAMAGHTLPTVINAAYQSDRNGIEIPAAFLQAPFYDPKADPASNFCALGAVIGHEITHGFDSQGRQYDEKGNFRNWWTDADAQRFVSEANKLVGQADAVEVLPGLHINGQLAVGENLADVGGISLGHAALKKYLREHPEKDRTIDDLSQDQRCFLSWAQVWADKSNEGWLKQKTPTDPHPPGVYRMIAPAQHEQGFYEAFGIRAGDPMWLQEKNRVTIW
jgi:putative endopeptidase